MSNLHRLTTSLVEVPARPGLRLALAIDGLGLIEHVTACERAYAEAEGVPLLAGNYVWPRLTHELLALLAGRMHGPHDESGTLLNCECGDAACWPLAARIRIFDRFVVWQEWRQLKREGRWQYRALEPLRFEIANYVEEMARVRSWLSDPSARPLTRRAETRDERKMDRPEISCAM